jgi:hypothetical protein
MAMARAVGAVLGVDMGLAHMEKLAVAGRHFAQMERLHRVSAGKGAAAADGEKKNGWIELPKQEKAELTRRSQTHLEAGCEKLLDAMADYFAMGVLLVGGTGVALAKLYRRYRSVNKLSKAIGENLKESEAEARSKLTINEDSVVTEIVPLKDGGKLEEVPFPKEKKTTGGLAGEPAPPDGQPRPEKNKPKWGQFFFDRCDSLKKRVELLKEHLERIEKPQDPARAKALDDLKGRTEYLLNSADLIKRTRGERALPLYGKEVQAFEADVVKKFPLPKPADPVSESEGLYVIQEPGELQGEPQRGKVPIDGKTRTESERSPDSTHRRFRAKLVERDGDVSLFSVEGKGGEISIVAETSMEGGTLILRNAHIQGGGKGTSSLAELRSVLEAIGRAEGAKEVIVFGGERTSGARPGHRPRPIKVKVPSEER